MSVHDDEHDRSIVWHCRYHDYGWAAVASTDDGDYSNLGLDFDGICLLVTVELLGLTSKLSDELRGISVFNSARSQLDASLLDCAAYTWYVTTVVHFRCDLRVRCFAPDRVPFALPLYGASSTLQLGAMRSVNEQR